MMTPARRRRAQARAKVAPEARAWIAELREANENLLLAALREQELVERANHSVRVRDHVLAVVSHDLSSPLLTIRIAAESLLSEAIRKDPKHAGQAVRNILWSVEQMRGQIQELRELAQIQHDRLILRRERLSLGHLAAEVVDNLRPLAEAKRVRLRARKPAAEVAVWADRPKLVRVITNLVTNGIKFTDAGGSIRVAVGRRARTAVFTVRDTGRGITGDVLQRLFEPFFRPSGERTEGTGLGLYISRALVRAHGGDIHATSRPGRGSSFEVTMPLDRPRAGGATSGR